MNQIGIIVLYLGKLPAWFHYFLETCSRCSLIDWLIFSDQPLPDFKADNLFLNKFSVKDFSRLAMSKLGIPVSIQSSYKLCDYKPTYGLLFEDYLEKYEYWGYSDVDIIYGRFDKFLEEWYTGFDIISSYTSFCSGPLCLYRNTYEINSLFKRINNYNYILADPKYYALDENVKINPSKYITRKILLSRYLLRNFKSLIRNPKQIEEIRYQFQWFLKSHLIEYIKLNDMSELLYAVIKMKEYKVWFSDLMKSDVYFNRIQKKDWVLEWNDGVLTDMVSGNEIQAFHFLGLKDAPEFSIPESLPPPGKFYVSPKGIFTDLL